LEKVAIGNLAVSDAPGDVQMLQLVGIDAAPRDFARLQGAGGGDQDPQRSPEPGRTARLANRLICRHGVRLLRFPRSRTTINTTLAVTFPMRDRAAVRAANSVVRVRSSHGRSHRFESCAAHCPTISRAYPFHD